MFGKTLFQSKQISGTSSIFSIQQWKFESYFFLKQQKRIFVDTNGKKFLLLNEHFCFSIA